MSTSTGEGPGGYRRTAVQQDNRLPEAFFSRNAPCPASGAD
ncbi:hypothetical protein [Paenibacillus chitinolyticus]|nr:hypothetical protein [Paenibacillus chitinolyticus]